MNNVIKVFENEEFGKVRTVIKDYEPWLVGKDVAVILGYAKPENAIAAHVDSEDKTSTLIQGTGSNYKSKTTIINESGFYSLVLSSKMPRAKEFKRWVTGEILPTIRRTGGYVSNEDMFWTYNKKVDKYDIIEDRKRRNQTCLQRIQNTHRNLSKQSSICTIREKRTLKYKKSTEYLTAPYPIG